MLASMFVVQLVSYFDAGISKAGKFLLKVHNIPVECEKIVQLVKKFEKYKMSSQKLSL